MHGEVNVTANHKDSIQQSVSKKKQYKKPSFRKEKVFETLALTCGKTTEVGICGFSHRNS